MAVLAVLACGAIWALSRRKPVDHTNVNEVDAHEPVGVVTAALRSVAPPPAGAKPSAPESAVEAAPESGIAEHTREQTPTPAAASSTIR